MRMRSRYQYFILELIHGLRTGDVTVTGNIKKVQSALKRLGIETTYTILWSPYKSLALDDPKRDRPQYITGYTIKVGL